MTMKNLRQQIAWEREYKNPKLITKNEKPQADTLRFFKFLKKERKIILEGKNILDLGCGTGRNANYLAELGNNVIGIEIAKTALDIAKARSLYINLPPLSMSDMDNSVHVGHGQGEQKQGRVKYVLGDIGKHYDIASNSIDIILDVTSSNSLSEPGREVYLSEMNRVLKNNGYIFVRALCKDGDVNAKKLLKDSPGPENDTYLIKEMGLIERVFSREDFIKMYSKYFKILKLEKKTGYATFNNRIYKRNYWLSYMQK